VDVINATSRNGLAAGLERALPSIGFTAGIASTAAHHRRTTTIYYPDPSSAERANALAAMLGGLPTAQDSTGPMGHLRVVLSTDFTMPDDLAPNDGPGAADSSPTSVTSPAPGATSHSDAIASQPASLAGGGVPCVK